jgi:hypothetical protein
MNLGKLAKQAKIVIDKRGGMAGLKADAMELKNIAQSKVSTTKKAEEAAEAVADPGAPGPDKPATAPPAAGS